jgi:hypothetical protein
MRKNVASQVICAQLNSATDGSAVTSGSTTVYVTGDAGTQGTGSGTVTHKGQGCWSYVPTQAETNYNHVAFTFANATAISQTVQVYTISFDPHDAAGLGLSRLDAAVTTRASQASLDTLDDFVDTEVAAILADTNELQTDWVDGGRLDLLVDAIKAKTDNLPSDPADASDIASSFSTVNSTLSTIAGYIDTEVAAIKAKTDNLPTDPADASDIASSFSTVNTKLDTIDDFLDTEIAAIKAKTDNLPPAVKKNTALSAFMFMMIDSSDHVTPKTGLTITATRSIDGAAFGACANSAAEVSNGWYKIDLANTDLNGNVIALKFTATGADARNVTILPQT